MFEGAPVAQGFCVFDLHFIAINFLVKGKYFSAPSHLGLQTTLGFLDVREQFRGMIYKTFIYADSNIIVFFFSI